MLSLCRDHRGISLLLAGFPHVNPGMPPISHHCPRPPCIIRYTLNSLDCFLIPLPRALGQSLFALGAVFLAPPPLSRQQFSDTRTIYFCILLGRCRRRICGRYTAHKSATDSQDTDRHQFLSSFSLPSLSPFVESSRSPAPNRVDFPRTPIPGCHRPPRVFRLSSRRRQVVIQTRGRPPRRRLPASSPAAPACPPPHRPPPLLMTSSFTARRYRRRLHTIATNSHNAPLTSRLFTKGKIYNLAVRRFDSGSNLPLRPPAAAEWPPPPRHPPPA